MVEDMKKKDRETMDEMQREIDAAEMKIHAEAEEEEAREAAERAAEEKGSQENEAPSDSSDETEKTDLADELAKLQADLQEKDDRLKRLQADFENFRRRTNKEREELSAVVTQEILKSIWKIFNNK